MPDVVVTPRSPRLPLTIRIKISGSVPDTIGHTINLSEGGLCLKAAGMSPEPAIGSKLVVAARLPDGGPSFRMNGTVMWIEATVRDHLGRNAIALGLAFDAGQDDEVEELRAFIGAFRYHVASLDFPAVARAHDALGGFFAVREVATEEELLVELSTGQVGLVLLGEPVNGERGEARLRRLLAAREVERQPPIIYCGSDQPSDELREIVDRSTRIVFERLPIDALEIRTLARRLVEANVLGFEHDHLTGELERALDKLRLENSYLRVRATQPSHLEGLIGESTAIRAVVEVVERVAPLSTSVMLIGETGTGKDLVARAVHALSPRADKPFVALNCAAVAENLIDAELFGHVRGAFTGATDDHPGLLESANGGTVFLDEVGEMPPAMQAKLLRTLQSGEIRRIGSTRTTRVDVRVVCATNRDLGEMVKDRTFREDLYYRLRAFVISLPPLRERPGDVPLLVFHFLDRCSGQHGKPAPGLTLEAMRLLEEYPWPGNVRELAYAVEGLVIVCPAGRKIDGPLVRETLGLATLGAPISPARTLDDAVEEYERQMITAELTRAGGVLAQAARALGVDRTTLSKRCKRLGLRAVPT